MDPLSIARYGMMAAETRLAATARAVAGAGDVDAAQAAVAQVEARQQFVASAKVVGVSNEMWRSLMDIQSS